MDRSSNATTGPASFRMNLYFRLLITIIRSCFEAPMSTRKSCTQWFRVLPTDIDAFGHMNNGRYLQIMDVARLRWLIRTGTTAAIRRNRWTVALGGNMTRFRRPLKAFTRYRVVSRLACWSERWFFLEHVFYDREGRRLATGLSRAAFRGAGNWISTAEVMDNVDPGVTSPAIPPHVADWLEIEGKMYDAAQATTLRPDGNPVTSRLSGKSGGSFQP